VTSSAVPTRLHEALQKAVRARDEVLGIVAHDLRNPLSAVVLHAADAAAARSAGAT